jgi:hypothetical protein
LELGTSGNSVKQAIFCYFWNFSCTCSFQAQKLTLFISIIPDSPSSSTTPPSANVYKADAVVCAVPLGCLKESKTTQLKVDEDENLCVPAIRFDPELSAEKREAISAIPTGSINKVIMIFERRFWTDNHFFGRINDKE